MVEGRRCGVKRSACGEGGRAATCMRSSAVADLPLPPQPTPTPTPPAPRTPLPSSTVNALPTRCAYVNSSALAAPAAAAPSAAPAAPTAEPPLSAFLPFFLPFFLPPLPLRSPSLPASPPPASASSSPMRMASSCRCVLACAAPTSDLKDCCSAGSLMKATQMSGSALRPRKTAETENMEKGRLSTTSAASWKQKNSAQAAASLSSSLDSMR